MLWLIILVSAVANDIIQQQCPGFFTTNGSLSCFITPQETADITASLCFNSI